ncbi:MAG: NADH-quinone oxidoreductase subunit J [Candidatus Edwardsbacteria bacterium]
MPILHLILLLFLTLFSLLAILARDLLRAAISLAVASVFLAILFFRMEASYAGVFELSVVAGLITVLFISTIAMTKQEEGQKVKEPKAAFIVFPVVLVLFLLVDILVMKKLLQRPVASLSGTVDEGALGMTLWQKRGIDLLGQIAVIFAGVFGVLALFREKTKH